MRKSFAMLLSAGVLAASISERLAADAAATPLGGDPLRGKSLYQACRDPATLNLWLTDPSALVPDPHVRADIIAYLSTAER